MRVINAMSGTYQLMVKLLYGSGLRISECIRLRVKDIDFDQQYLTVRDGKGEKDRVTMLPESLLVPLKNTSAVLNRYTKRIWRMVSEDPLPDFEAECDELFQNAGKIGDENFDPLDSPLLRANKRRGRGTYENDRPPIVGVIGFQGGEVHLRVVMDTKASTLEEHVHSFTLPYCHIYTDEYDSYNGIERTRLTVAHEAKKWARDDDGDGVREVHTNAAEGMWTDFRNFFRLFRGVHKKYLAGYVAAHDYRVNLKRISPEFISALVKVHSFNS